MLKLVVEKGPREGDTHEFPTTTNAVVKIGRVVRGNTIAFKEDDGISYKHLLIEFKSPNWLISDLNSSNGTTLNTSTLSPLCPTQLTDGDVVKFGEYTSIKVQIVGSVESPSPPRRRLRARKEDGSGCDLGAKVAVKKPPAGRGQPEKRARVAPEVEEVEEKVEIEVQPANTRRTTRSSAKAAGSSNQEPSNQIIGDRPKRGGGRRKKPLPEAAEDVVSEYAGDNSGPPPVCENAGENVVQSKQADEAGGHPEMEVSGQVGSRPKRGGGRRKKPLPEVMVSECAGDNAGPPPVCKNAGENVVPSDLNEGDYTSIKVQIVGSVESPSPPTRRLRARKEDGSGCDLAGKVAVKKPPAGRGRPEKKARVAPEVEEKVETEVQPVVTRRTTRSSAKAAGSSNPQPSNQIDGDRPKRGGGRRKKPLPEVAEDVVSEYAGGNSGPPPVCENAGDNVVPSNLNEGDAGRSNLGLEEHQERDLEVNNVGIVPPTLPKQVAVQASDADKEDVRRSHLGRGENNVDFEQEPDLEKMTLGDWFDYLEVYLPKQIIKETEEIVSSMKHKADQVYEYKLKHKNDQGKGKSAAM